MKKLTLTALALLLAGLFALPSTAMAQEIEPAPDDDVTVAGKGALFADGVGEVDIDMGGRLRLRVDGDVTIVDNAGDLRIRTRGGSGDAGEERIGNIALSDYRGLIQLRGTDFTVEVDGEVALSAQGRGQALLVGDGVYKTRNGERMTWDGMVRIGGTDVEAAA